jgi:predicted phage terminase large subunit-like protein
MSDASAARDDEQREPAEDPQVVGHIEPLTAEQQIVYLNLTPPEQARFLALLREQRELREGVAIAPLTYRDFVDRVTGGRYRGYRYALVLASVLQQVCDGLLKRVLIFAPPRHGKSEAVSRLFPAYYLYRHPERWVGLCAHTAELAHTLSRAARGFYFTAHERQSTGAVKQWETGRGGGLWAAGVGGAILGKGFHLGLIDDPVKNAEEAASDRVRESHLEWYQSVFYTRAEPDAAIVIIQQRWNEEDLAGSLLKQEWAEAEHEGADDAEPERWHIVNFEALRSTPAEIKQIEEDEGRPLWPPTCTIEPDWRAPGEALAPERYPRERLLKIKRRLGPYFWSALYQQRPRPKSGLLFQIEKITIVADVDIPWRVLQVVRYWDKAATEGAGNFTVGALLGFDVDSEIVYLLDLERGQWEPGKRNEIIKDKEKSDRARFGNRLVTWCEQEGGSSGIDSGIQFRKMLLAQGAARVFIDKVAGSAAGKLERAVPFAAATNVSMVRMIKAHWNGALRRELADFPNGAYDDIVDACAGAYNKVVVRRPRKGSPFQPSRSQSSAA